MKEKLCLLILKRATTSSSRVFNMFFFVFCFSHKTKQLKKKKLQKHSARQCSLICLFLVSCGLDRNVLITTLELTFCAFKNNRISLEIMLTEGLVSLIVKVIVLIIGRSDHLTVLVQLCRSAPSKESYLKHLTGLQSIVILILVNHLQQDNTVNLIVGNETRLHQLFDSFVIYVC